MWKEHENRHHCHPDRLRPRCQLLPHAGGQKAQCEKTESTLSVVSGSEVFKRASGVIVANRETPIFANVKDQVFP